MSTASNSESVDPPTPDSAAELESLDYGEKQSLAAEHGFGRIVGIEEQELEDYLTDTLDFEATAEQSETDERAEEPDEQAGSEPEPDSERDTVSDSTTEDASTAETDGLGVGHEGKEKLSPENAPDDDGTAVEPPEGLDLEGIGPDDLEPQPAPTEEQETEPEPQPSVPEEQNESNQSESGGLLSKIKGDDSDEQRSTEEIVEDTDDPAERERREDVLSALKGSDPDAGAADQPEEPDPTQMQNGMVVDESLVSTLFGMPFDQAAQATGWDGWTLSESEKQANAQLLVAYCDEQNIDLSTGSLLAMSLVQTIGGRAAGYARYRKQESDDSNQRGEHRERPDRERQRDDSESETDDEPDESEDERESGGKDEFDFDDSDTWN
ncbi:hypothetical protein C475_17888 [Halosimplex carlsbadense 2-9-1]|uniref:Uncharacterized protein n=1 Tax=Halosimplex carlsbadense 2-9-1 TaxID=797114 RepID=M0CIE3_9EURY|nr:hypothetical protein [Halosimplex carlsbadense]ELZ22408.1 hypothetical protein C475_17888 [Halosimplex carlsbadense 2-9-1]